MTALLAIRRRAARALGGLLLFAALAAPAQNLTPATLTFSLSPDQPSYWAGQRVRCTLRLDLGGDDIANGGQLTLAGFPESDETFDLSTFAPGPSSAGVREWSADLTLLAPRDVPIRPQIGGQRRHLTGGNGGFFRQYQVVPFSATAAARTLHVQPLPAAGRPADFCDAVGPFEFEASLTPTNAAPGDIVTLAWSLRGPGAELGRAVAYDPGAFFKTYPPRIEDRGEGLLSVTQVVIPLGTNSVEAAAFSVSFFEPASCSYRTCVSGPFALMVAERPPEEAERIPDLPEPPGFDVSPTAGSSDVPPPAAGVDEASIGSDWVLPTLLPARIAPAKTSYRLFEIPAGTIVRVREVRGSWRRVLLSDGASGWIEISVP